MLEGQTTRTDDFSCRRAMAIGSAGRVPRRRSGSHFLGRSLGSSLGMFTRIASKMSFDQRSKNTEARTRRPKVPHILYPILNSQTVDLSTLSLDAISDFLSSVQPRRHLAGNPLRLASKGEPVRQRHRIHSLKGKINGVTGSSSYNCFMISFVDPNLGTFGFQQPTS